MSSLLYSKRGTAIEFKSSGGVLFAPTSLASNAGWKSDRWDLGDGAHANRFFGRIKLKTTSAPAIGAILTAYAIFGDGIDADEDLTTGNGAMPSMDRFRNLTPICSVVASSATTGPFVSPMGIIECDDRYLQIAWANTLGVALSATATDHLMRIYSAPLESQ